MIPPKGWGMTRGVWLIQSIPGERMFVKTLGYEFDIMGRSVVIMRPHDIMYLLLRKFYSRRHLPHARSAPAHARHPQHRGVADDEWGAHYSQRDRISGDNL